MNIQTVKDLIEEGRLGNALKQLRQHLRTEDVLLHNQLSLLRSRFNTLQMERSGDLISRRDYITDVNRLTKDVLSYLDSLEEQDIAGIHTQEPQSAAPTKETFDHPLLLIGHNQESVYEIQSLLRLLKFSTIQALSLPLDLEKLDLSSHKLILFDNSDLPFCQSPSKLAEFSEEQQSLIRDRIEIMESTLAQGSSFLIHYGTYLYWINRHNKRIYAANSQIALFARIKEALAFIEAIRV